MKKVKILITVAAWNRRQITDLCYKGIKRLMSYKPNKFDITALVVYSNDLDRALADSYGFRTIYADNKPFGAKLNKGLNEALKMNFDYKLGLGSDDLISNKLLELYYHYFKNNVGIIGVQDLALVEASTKDAKTFSYGQMIGAGRAIKKSLLQKAAIRYKARVEKSFFDTRVGINFKKGQDVLVPMSITNQYLRRLDAQKYVKLWDDSLQGGADSNSQKALKAFENDIVRVEAEKPLVVDIKSALNITSFESLKGPAIEIENLYDDFPELKLL